MLKMCTPRSKQVLKRAFSNLQTEKIAVVTRGEGFSFRAYLENAEGKRLSPWHDLGLKGINDDTDEFTAFFEIPR